MSRRHSCLIVVASVAASFGKVQRQSSMLITLIHRAALLTGAAWLAIACTATGSAPDFAAGSRSELPAPPPGPPAQASPPLGSDELFLLYETVLTDYVERVDQAALVLGAFKGARMGADELGLMPAETAVLDQAPVQFTGDPRRDWALFAVAYDAFLGKIARRIDVQAVGHGAASGMLAALGDPLTEYLDPAGLARLQLSRIAQIGAVLGPSSEGAPVVRELVPNGPAAQAGLAVGDWVRAVDGHPTAGGDFFQALEALSGEDGSQVSVRVERPGTPSGRDLQLTRSLSSAPPVSTSTRDGIDYIQLRALEAGAADLVRRTLIDSAARGTRGWIIDLRGNNGGRLPEAVNVASLFIGERTIALQESRRGGRSPVPGTSVPLGAPRPLVVLTDGSTAGPAEVLAGALRDYELATVVGTRTAGRMASVTLVPLGERSGAVIATQRFLTPSGGSLLRDGVDPDIVVQLEPEGLAAGHDLPLDRALALLR